VQPAEVGELQFEVSVLTEPKPLEFASPEDLLSKLRPHLDGVILNLNGRRATFLPQVWEQLPDKVTFLDQLSQKAGYGPGEWRKSGTSVLIYQVEAFKDSSPSANRRVSARRLSAPLRPGQATSAGEQPSRRLTLNDPSRLPGSTG